MYQAIVFLPLIGALIAGFGGRAIGAKASEYVTTLFLIVAAVLSWVAFFTVAMGETEMIRVPVMRWIDSGSFSVDWALRIDTLTAVMLCGGQHGVLAGPSLFDRLHASRPASAAVLCLSVTVHLRHADAGDVGQPAADVLRLGRRWCRPPIC